MDDITISSKNVATATGLGQPRPASPRPAPKAPRQPSRGDVAAQPRPLALGPTLGYANGPRPNPRGLGLEPKWLRNYCYYYYYYHYHYYHYYC